MSRIIWIAPQIKIKFCYVHKCTGVENPREGVPDVFCQNPQGGGGSRLSGKIAWGSPYFRFYCIFINKCFEICLRGVIYLPSPHLAPVCIYGYVKKTVLPHDQKYQQSCPFTEITQTHTQINWKKRSINFLLWL